MQLTIDTGLPHGAVPQTYTQQNVCERATFRSTDFNVSGKAYFLPLPLGRAQQFVLGK